MEEEKTESAKFRLIRKLIPSAIILMFSGTLIFFYHEGSYPTANGLLPYSFPMFVLTTIFILAALLFLKSMFQRTVPESAQSAGEDEASTLSTKGTLPRIFIFACIFAYAMLLRRVGFLASTTICISPLIFFYRGGRLVPRIVVSIVGSAILGLVVFFIFAVLLGVDLPMLPFFDRPIANAMNEFIRFFSAND
ncbi:MAG: tripartite tricarboxylate transporter TctB family protein [Planctomycetes bacterium]|nr:tripartite tricarboxylate transporter TctB family protein [Planctomycetota bacterium]